MAKMPNNQFKRKEKRRERETEQRKKKLNFAHWSIDFVCAARVIICFPTFRFIHHQIDYQTHFSRSPFSPVHCWIQFFLRSVFAPLFLLISICYLWWIQIKIIGNVTMLYIHSECRIGWCTATAINMRNCVRNASERRCKRNLRQLKWSVHFTQN